MRFTLFFLFINFSFFHSYSQCTKMESLDKLLAKNQFEKAENKAIVIAKKDKQAIYPYYFLSKLYLTRFEQKNQLNYLTSALSSAYKAKNRDRKGYCMQEFASTLNTLKESSLRIADSLFLAEKMENATFYYDLIAKTYGDTSQNYLSILQSNKQSEPKSSISELTQAGKDFNLLSKEDLSHLNQTNKQGVKIGRWIKFYENGLMAYNVYFQNGKPYGNYIRYHENGARKAFLQYNSQGFAKATLFDEDTSIIASGFYSGINKDSSWIYYYPSGKAAAIVNYHMGLRNGRTKIFYPDGNLLDELDFKNGQKEGIWRQFYPSGKKRLETKYKNNEKNGPFYLYYESGVFDTKGSYLNGLRNGTWSYFDKSNNLIKTEVYVNGKLPIELKLDSLNNELNIKQALFSQAKQKNKSVEEIQQLNRQIIALKNEISKLEKLSPEEKETKELKYLDEREPASADPMNYINNPSEYLLKNKNK